ncbi:GerMN domain-containing protein [Gorillibacterium massiliense]|uniref:GerMN domain-containing protein n=1 Tax=Gorillibacterium massiliense TaxID=1280390 RepID=UPI0005926CCB|nr:GerMN domain-containing protein [Gorillibacterium massiliense]
MRKAAISAALLLSAMIVVSGCGENGGKKEGEAPSPSPSIAATTTPAPTASAVATVTPQAPEETAVKLYFADPDLAKLIETTRTIPMAKDKPDYIQVLQALETTDDSGQISLFKDFDFKKAELADGQLTVDLNFGSDSRLGSGGEMLLLQALKNTLFQFPEVKSINVLVDGQQVESLMGNADLPHPILRQN